jgi:hypothetical protein
MTSGRGPDAPRDSSAFCVALVSMQAASAKAVASNEIGEEAIGSNVHLASGGRDRYAPFRGLVIPTRRASSIACFEPQMRHFLRPLSLLIFAGCAAGLPEGRSRVLAAANVECERAEHGVDARAIAIYTRVIADRVCVLDAAGHCHPRADGASTSAEVRLPQSKNTPPATALRRELERRGVLARVTKPRGPKMYASLGDMRRNADFPILELSEIGISEDGSVAHVMLRASGTIVGDRPTAPGGELVRLTRTLGLTSETLSRRMTSPIRACWRLERSMPSALAD